MSPAECGQHLAASVTPATAEQAEQAARILAAVEPDAVAA